LITIRFQEEQEFISNFFRTNKIADNIWIGVEYKNNKYKWNDDSDLIFSNWEQGSPKNKTDHCVQMISDENSFGKWSDVLCTKKNLVVCQKMQTLSLTQLQKILFDVKKNPVPIGFIYVQLPNEKSPTEIWPWMIWNDISSTYANVFFRVTGDKAASFGKIQEENTPRIEKLFSTDDKFSRTNNTSHCISWDCDTIIPKEGNSSWTYVGANSGQASYISFGSSNGEVRPRNMAIRIWKRTG